MPATIINGKAIAASLETKLKIRVQKLKKLGILPRLGVIFVGDDRPSQTYIRKKQEAALRIGIDFKLFQLPRTVKPDALVKEIKKIQSKQHLSGLIIQLPLPEKLYCSEVLNAVSSTIDVDCLTDANIGKLVMRTNKIFPPTPASVMIVLKSIGVDVAGKNITLIGTGSLVGKPLAIILMNEGASVTTCNSRTTNIKQKSLNADIIVTGVGKKDILRGNMIKHGAVVIDTGICFVDGKMCGDVNRTEITAKAGYLSPTPGGVGPITVAKLLENVIICAEQMHKKI